MSRPSRRERSQSVDRAAELLRVLAVQGPQRLADLDARFDAPRRGLQRLLVSLEHAGLIGRDPESRRYELGPGLAVLGAIAAERIDLPRLAPPHVRHVRDTTGQTGMLLVRQDDAAVCAHIEVVADGPALILPLGRVVPLSSGAVRSILAFVDRGEVATTPEGPPPELAARLETVRAQGFEVARAEVLPGAIAVAAPVFDAVGEPVACVGALGYQGHLEPEACIGPVLAAAAGLTRALGGRPPARLSAPAPSQGVP